jgi:hypothetical protein
MIGYDKMLSISPIRIRGLCLKGFLSLGILSQEV